MSVEAGHCLSKLATVRQCPSKLTIVRCSGHCPSKLTIVRHCPSKLAIVRQNWPLSVSLATVRRSWPLSAAVSVPGRPVVSPGYYRLSVRGAGERGRRGREALGVTNVGVPPSKGRFISRRRDRDAVSFNGFPVAAASPLADNQCPSGSPSCLPPTCWSEAFWDCPFFPHPTLPLAVLPMTSPPHNYLFFVVTTLMVFCVCACVCVCLNLNYSPCK